MKILQLKTIYKLCYYNLQLFIFVLHEGLPNCSLQPYKKVEATHRNLIGIQLPSYFVCVIASPVDQTLSFTFLWESSVVILGYKKSSHLFFYASKSPIILTLIITKSNKFTEPQ
jgi:hypothetical protein